MVLKAGPAPLVGQSEANQDARGAFSYLDAKQKEMKIRSSDGKELYQAFRSGFLEWGRCYERQIVWHSVLVVSFGLKMLK